MRRAEVRRDVPVARPATESILAVMLPDLLKSETRCAHDRIEATLDLMRPDLTRSRYVAVLLRFQAFFRAWEPRVAAVLADEAFFKPRRRLHLLNADLRWFGADPLPEAAPLPPIRIPHEAMGSLYVLEGSTLGGLVIAKHVQRTLGISGPGALFFANRGGEAAERWREFKRRLETFGAPETDALVIRAANETFATLDRWLRLPGEAVLAGEAAPAAEPVHG